MCIRQWCVALLVARLVVHVLELLHRASRLIAQFGGWAGEWPVSVGTSTLLY